MAEPARRIYAVIVHGVSEDSILKIKLILNRILIGLASPEILFFQFLLSIKD